ncbi:MaoC family dehydratase [Croceicoccus ponticola]|uniref:MaoC family dehydratase n=1 Tax=Croceicoccus ponticola TaxID=2217664 RepID=A0A437H0Q3_9SPHN|nr:MaoC family dehydratase [Croceicoccus ponticola]RVQ69188.1 MaoC family dehydratase [Croceicoccus ponticola]
MPYFEEIELGASEPFGHYVVTRDEVIEFARRYDPQLFHLEDEAAAAGPFGKLAASGWMTAALTMKMLVDHRIGNDGTSLGGAGLKDLKWHRPVYPGDVLSVRQTIVDKRRSKSRPELGLITQFVETLDADGSVVMSMTTTGLFAVRDQAVTD